MSARNNGMSKNYVDNQELLEEVRKYKEDNNTPSDRLGMMLLEMHKRILTHKCFVGYHKDLKDEMMSVSLYRVIKGLHNFDETKSTPFAYITCAIFRNYTSVIMSYYKKKTQWEKYYNDMLNEITCTNKMNNTPMYDINCDN